MSDKLPLYQTTQSRLPSQKLIQNEKYCYTQIIGTGILPERSKVKVQV